jgi:hypothetical protein
VRQGASMKTDEPDDASLEAMQEMDLTIVRKE